jgi:2-isopropylmalate synthase
VLPHQRFRGKTRSWLEGPQEFATIPKSPNLTELIFDWAEAGPHRFRAPERVTINDETLRDGLQSPSVVDPPLATKIRILRQMDALGIECASLGMPGAGPRQQRHVEALCREVVDSKLSLRPNLGGRTVVADVEAIVAAAQRAGAAFEACLFIGSSPIRQYAEDWDFEHMLQGTREAIGLAVREGLPATFITEDTVRSRPEQLEALLGAAIDAGAHRVCLCDTVGSATHHGVMNLVGWVVALLEDRGVDVGIDWHGHRDRGLGMANTLAAIEAGADRVHATVLGIGERVGNTATEQVLVNLQLLGLAERDLSRLPALVETVAEALGVAVAPSTPIVGRDAFRTAAGVHAAAVLKAGVRGEAWLEDRVYSGVPASWVGRRQAIEVGPLSGISNVRHFLRAHGLGESPAVIERLLAAAKASRRVLSERELLDLVGSADAKGTPRDSEPT